jgi:hypothetical protein
MQNDKRRMLESMVNDQNCFVSSFIILHSSLIVSSSIKFPAKLFFICERLRAETAFARLPEMDKCGDKFGALEQARVASFGHAQTEIITGVGIAARSRRAKLRDSRPPIRRP